MARLAKRLSGQWCGVVGVRSDGGASIAWWEADSAHTGEQEKSDCGRIAHGADAWQIARTHCRSRGRIAHGGTHCTWRNGRRGPCGAVLANLSFEPNAPARRTV